METMIICLLGNYSIIRWVEELMQSHLPDLKASLFSMVCDEWGRGQGRCECLREQAAGQFPLLRAFTPGCSSFCSWKLPSAGAFAFFDDRSGKSCHPDKQGINMAKFPFSFPQCPHPPELSKGKPLTELWLVTGCTDAICEQHSAHPGCLWP